jgi:hypothetical protein
MDGPNPVAQTLYSVLWCVIFFAGGFALQYYAENSILGYLGYGLYFLSGLALLEFIRRLRIWINVARFMANKD